MKPAKFFVDDEEDDIDDQPKASSKKQATDPTGLIEKVKNILRQHYEPVSSPKDATLHYSTNEIYEQLQKLIPSINYSTEDVAVWLHEAGFTFYDYGVLQFEWMMRKV